MLERAEIEAAVIELGLPRVAAGETEADALVRYAGRVADRVRDARDDDEPGPAYTHGHRDVQVGVTDDAMPIERCERCGRQRIGIYPEDPCPGSVARSPQGEDHEARVAEAADRLFMHGILDEIYDCAYRQGRGESVTERDAAFDAEVIARIVLSRVSPSRDGTVAAPDPASVLAVLLAERPDATIAALETLLTSDEDHWREVARNTLEAAHLAPDDHARLARAMQEIEGGVSAACRSLRPKAPKEDG